MLLQPLQCSELHYLNNKKKKKRVFIKSDLFSDKVLKGTCVPKHDCSISVKTVIETFKFDASNNTNGVFLVNSCSVDVNAM